MSPKRLFFLSGEEEEEKIRGVAVCCMGEEEEEEEEIMGKEGRKEGRGLWERKKGSHIPRVRFDNIFRMLCDRSSYLELAQSKFIMFEFF